MLTSLGVCPVPPQEQLETAAGDLPRESPVLAKLLSCAAVSQFKWAKVPSVAVFGSFAPEEEGGYPAAAAAAAAATAGTW
jgi:hypothetical protein